VDKNKKEVMVVGILFIVLTLLFLWLTIKLNAPDLVEPGTDDVYGPKMKSELIYDKV